MSIKTGDCIPLISALNHEGKPVVIDPNNLSASVVIYFYPKDDTPGCTKEACSFRDSHEAFTDAGVKVYGISSDSVESHRKFREKYNLPFDLLTDNKNQIRKAFGVPTNLLGLLPGRVTYVVDKSGTIRHIFNSQLNAERHVTEALEAIKSL